MGRQVKFKVGIIGCGLIGSKRAKFLGPYGKLVACADKNIKTLRKFYSNKKIKRFINWQKLLKLEEIDIVIIATPHFELAKILIEAYNKKKHILVEKPAAKNFTEVKKIVKKIKNNKIKIRVGYNHRYHPSVLRAKKIIKNGMIGKLMYIRARYGHGGRIGYEKEWRAKKSLSGGGELLDQGSHLIDLSRMFLGEFVKILGTVNTFFWKMKVDDNAFLILSTNKKRIAFLHASWTEWKNMFSFEIFGTKGKIDINGKGGSYGVENIILYKMKKKMGKPNEKKWVYKNKDISWVYEMKEFYKDIMYNRKPSINLMDAYQTLKIIDKIYRQ